jgi:murein L,D-transpeptidase YafK
VDTLLATLVAIAFAIWHAVAPRPVLPLEEPVDRIVIDKSDRTLALMRDGRMLRRYPMGLGFAPEGDKHRQGDGRTPEGTFRIDRRNDQSRFHLSLGLDYPQPEDIARAAEGGYSPGGDIFIHGQPAGIEGRARLSGDWTEGCIAVTNANMEEIWRVTPLGTEVEIVP